MINIGFWNVSLNRRKKDFEELIITANNAIAGLIKHQNLDILALCEFPIQNPAFLFEDVVRDKEYEEAYYINQRLDTRIFYSKRTVACNYNFSTIDEERNCMNRFSAGGYEFNLSCVHLPSKLYYDDNTRKLLARLVLTEIQEIEAKYDKRTIIVGDFNADPHESTMLGADGFHALPDKKYAKTGRKVQKQNFDAFYNPMWNLYGDFIPPTGTYFYNNSQETNQLWYLFDQMIMRPTMIDKLVPESLRIIFDNVKDNLGRPGISDHFPIVFALY